MGGERTLVEGEPVTALTTPAKLGWRRPWCAGVPGLVQERREPRDEGRDSPTATAARAGWGSALLVSGRRRRAHTMEIKQPDPDDPDQIEGPVLGVEQGSGQGRRPRAMRLPGFGVVSARCSARMPQPGEQHLQRIHPRFGGVVDGKGGGGEKDRRRPRYGPIPPDLSRAQSHATGSVEHAEDPERERPESRHRTARRSSSRSGAGSRKAEGRRPASSERGLMERQPGDVDRQCLIEPERRRGHEAEDPDPPRPARWPTSHCDIHG